MYFINLNSLHIKLLVGMVLLFHPNKLATSFQNLKYTIKISSTINKLNLNNKIRYNSIFQIYQNRGFGSNNKNNEPIINMDSIQQLAKQKQLDKTLDDYQNNIKKKVFEDTITFPSTFVIKIVGINDSSFVSDILNIIQNNVGIQPKFLTHNLKETSGGKYISITISPYFYNSDEIYNLYTIISKDERVKFMI